MKDVERYDFHTECDTVGYCQVGSSKEREGSFVKYEDFETVVNDLIELENAVKSVCIKMDEDYILEPNNFITPEGNSKEIRTLYQAIKNSEARQ